MGNRTNLRKLLIVSHCPPAATWGGAMTFYRHFIQSGDFEVKVFHWGVEELKYNVPHTSEKLSRGKIWEKLTRTRFAPIVHGVEYLFGSFLLKNEQLKKMRAFNPDVVFTVAGSWDATALIAQKCAKALKVPLIASFNDWFDYGSFLPARVFHPLIENRFRKFYREADLALCTCEGMREALGEHPNAHVWYPTGSSMLEEIGESSKNEKFRVLFGGSLGDWYGPMLERLVKYCSGLGLEIEFRIFGALQTWSDEFDEWARKNSVYRGKVTFEVLSAEALRADLLLLPMGFAEQCAHVERTSFKTKFLDYLSFGRPILVWGPWYCSAVRVAKEFDSAECVLVDDVEVVASSLNKLKEDSQRCSELKENAFKMYQSRFNPATIHSGLLSKINEIVK